MADRRAEVELGFTKSMGEGTYEFLRVDIRQSDSPRNDETLDEATDRLYDAVEAKLIEKVRQIDEELGAAGRHSKIHSKE